MANTYAGTNITLGHVLKYHEKYIQALYEYDSWLLVDDNKKKLDIYNLILFVIDKKKGEWKDKSNVPEVSDITSWCCNTINWQKFDEKYRKKKAPFEMAALELTAKLNDKEIIKQFEALSPESQLNFMNKVVSRLADSEVGRKFLKESLKEPTNPNDMLPIFNPGRIIKIQANFEFALFREACAFLAAIVMKLMPALLDQTKEKASHQLLIFMKKIMNLTDTAYITIPPGPCKESFLALKQYADKARQTLNGQYGTITDQRTAGVLMFFVEVVQAYLIAAEYMEKPDLRNSTNFIQALARIQTGYDEMRGVFDKAYEAGLSKFHKRMFGVLTGIYDFSFSAYDGYLAYKTKDDYLVAGNAMVATSAVMGAAWAFAGEAVIAVSPTWANPYVGAVVSVTVALLSFVGAVMVATLKTPEIEKWFKNNYFGNEHQSLEDEVTPNVVTFHWALKNGKTDSLARQISEFASLFSPINATIEAKLSASVDDYYCLHMTFKPSVVHFESYIIIREIDENGKYKPGFVHFRKLIEDEADSEGNPVVNIEPINFGDASKVIKWTYEFTNYIYDPRGNYYEVMISPPGMMNQDFVTKAKQDPDLLDQLTYLIRQRVKVT